MKIAITFAALAAASAVSFGAQTVFVAPGGSDSEGLGTKEKPFASLNRAIREFYSSKPGDFEICVAEGEYFFSKGVSIVAQHTNGKTLSIAGPNFSGEPKARFIGGIKIPAKYLEKVSDKELNTLKQIFIVNKRGYLEEDATSNWKGYLVKQLRNQETLLELDMYESVLDSITAAELRDEFRKCFDTGRYMILSIGPFQTFEDGKKNIL